MGDRAHRRWPAGGTLARLAAMAGLIWAEGPALGMECDAHLMVSQLATSETGSVFIREAALGWSPEPGIAYRVYHRSFSTLLFGDTFRVGLRRSQRLWGDHLTSLSVEGGVSLASGILAAQGALEAGLAAQWSPWPWLAFELESHLIAYSDAVLAELLVGPKFSLLIDGLSLTPRLPFNASWPIPWATPRAASGILSVTVTYKLPV